MAEDQRTDFVKREEEIDRLMEEGKLFRIAGDPVRRDDFTFAVVLEGKIDRLPTLGVLTEVKTAVPDVPDPDADDLVILDGRAWPLIANARYQFTGEEVARLMSESAIHQPGLEVQAFAVEQSQTWALAHDRAQGVLGAGSATFGSEGVHQLRRLIDGEGTPEEHDQMMAILDAAVAAGERAEKERS